MNLSGFDRVVAIDTEYTPVVGGHIRPICLVAHELDIWGTGQVVAQRAWTRATRSRPMTARCTCATWPPPRSGFTCVRMAGAGPGARFVRRVPQPQQQSDTQESRTSSRTAWAMRWNFSISARSTGTPSQREESHAGSRGARRSVDREEKQELLDYCEADVEVLAPLMERMLIHIRAKRKAPGAPRRGLVQALHRGRYMNAVAEMERTGPPIDVPTFGWMKEHRLEVLEYLIEGGDRDTGCSRGPRFRKGLFRKYLARQGLLDTWPRTEQAGLSEHRTKTP